MGVGVLRVSKSMEDWVAQVNRLAELIDAYATRHDVTQWPHNYNYNALVSAWVTACKQANTTAK